MDGLTPTALRHRRAFVPATHERYRIVARPRRGRTRPASRLPRAAAWPRIPAPDVHGWQGLPPGHDGGWGATRQILCAEPLERPRPGLANELDAEGVVRLAGAQLEALGLVGAAGGGQHALGPEHNARV